MSNPVSVREPGLDGLRVRLTDRSVETVRLFATLEDFPQSWVLPVQKKGQPNKEQAQAQAKASNALKKAARGAATSRKPISGRTSWDAS